MSYSKLMMTVAVLLFNGIATAQSLEIYAGHKRVGVDVMWFKNFKNMKDAHTPFLFFSRNRASVDYQNAPAAFGSTNAISYNFKNGMGVVTVAAFLNAGFTPKAGVQYYKQKGDCMFFGWLVADIKKEGSVDLFGLFRYQPKIKDKWRVFSQAECFPVYHPTLQYWNITERLRFGVKCHALAGGLMADFNQSGKTNLTKTQNFGGFLRWEF